MARRDFQRFSGGDFTTTIAFENSDGTMTATITGIASKIHYTVDLDGNIGNDRMAWISVSEKTLTDEGYIVRNDKDIVALENHRVSWADSTGTTKKYVVARVHPDEMLGVLLIYLGSFK